MKRTNFLAMVFGITAVLLFIGPELLSAAPAAKNGKPLAGYTTIIVEKFTIENNAATEKFPRGYETVMHGEMVNRLRKRGIFEHVIDGEKPTEESNPSPGDAKQPEKTLTLSGTVISYDKGNRAARYLVNFGAGATKVKVRFVLLDAQSGQELLKLDRQGKFYGVFGMFGGSRSQADAKSARSVVQGLIRAIEARR